MRGSEGKMLGSGRTKEELEERTKDWKLKKKNNKQDATAKAVALDRFSGSLSFWAVNM